MAELCVTVADVLGSMAGEEVDTFDQSAKVVKFNDVVLAIGKCVDLAADWVLVAQLQDGTFGPRPLVLVATAICATMGTLVELYAIVVLFRIQDYNEQVYGLKHTLLNRKLAWWRFGSDDLPTCVIGLFLLIGPAPIVPAACANALLPSPPPPAACANPCGSEACADVADIDCVRLESVFGCDCFGCCAINGSSANAGDCETEFDDSANAYSTMGDSTTAYAVVIVSLAYSVYALSIHLLRPPPMPDKELLKECYDVGIEVSVLEDFGFRALNDLHAVGYYERLRDAKEAGHTCKEAKNAGYSLEELRQAYSLQEIGGVLSELKRGGMTGVEAKTQGYAMQEIKAGGFSCREAKDGGYSWPELKQAYSAEEIVGALREMKMGGLTCTQAKEAGYGCHEAELAGWSWLQGQQAGYGCCGSWNSPPEWHNIKDKCISCGDNVNQDTCMHTERVEAAKAEGTTTEVSDVPVATAVDPPDPPPPGPEAPSPPPVDEAMPPPPPPPEPDVPPPPPPADPELPPPKPVPQLWLPPADPELPPPEPAPQLWLPPPPVTEPPRPWRGSRVTACNMTEAAYGNSSEDKLSKKSISAYELRTKIKSNQFIHEKAGMPDASFDYYDLQGDECAQINQSVLQWALDNASDAAVQRYNEIGTQMVFGADKESINGGAWIPDPMTYKTDEASNTMTLTSKILTTDHHEPVVMFRDMHYCKVLSPFRAMEWIYVDSLYVKDSLTSTTNETQALFLQ